MIPLYKTLAQFRRTTISVTASTGTGGGSDLSAGAGKRLLDKSLTRLSTTDKMTGLEPHYLPEYNSTMLAPGSAEYNATA